MRNLIVYFLFLFLGVGAFGQGLRDSLTATYLSNVGIREATGHNDGAKVEVYLRSVNLPKGNPWCAAFVSYCLQVNHIKNPRSGWAPAYFSTTSTIWTRGNLNNRLPMPGDIFGIYFQNKGRIAHVGFVHRFGNKYTITVEGNTNEEGSREGDGVYLKRRLTKQLYKISRYVR